MLHSTRRRILPLSALTALLMSLVLVVPVLAAPTTFTTGLTGAQEVPGPGDPDGSGSATITIDPALASGSQLCYNLMVANITLPAAAAHIHEEVPGAAGPVVVTLGTPDVTGAAVGCAADADFNLANSGDPDIATLLADIVANPGDYYVNIHTSDFSAGAVRGQLASMVMVMKHLCDPSIQTEADFMAVEARAATNPTTPMGVPTLGSTTETVLACPVIVQPGDGQTPGALGSGSRTFDFTTTDAGAMTQTLTTDTTFSGDDGFGTPVEDFACENTVGYDADRNGTVAPTPCLDFSSYAFHNVREGQVTVAETVAPPGARFGTVRLSPPEISDDAAVGLAFTSAGVITFNSSADTDAMVTLHVYNFQAALVAATQTPTPVATALPNTAIGGDPEATPIPTLGLALALLGSLATLVLLRSRTTRARNLR